MSGRLQNANLRYANEPAIGLARDPLRVWAGPSPKALLMHLCARIGYTPPEVFPF